MRPHSGPCQLPLSGGETVIRHIGSQTVPRKVVNPRAEQLQTTYELLPVANQNEGRPVIRVRPAGRDGIAGCSNVHAPVRSVSSIGLQNAVGHLLLGLAQRLALPQFRLGFTLLEGTCRIQN